MAGVTKPDNAGVSGPEWLDRALEQLERLNERLARVVELRFLGELTVEETAAVLGVTERTVRRDWRKARSYLHDSMRSA